MEAGGPPLPTRAPEPEPTPDRPRAAPGLEDVWAAWTGWRVSHQRVRPGTHARDRECLASATRELRAVHRIPDARPIPLGTLDIPTCMAVAAALEDRGNGSSRVQAVLRKVHQAWTWAADEPEQWPGLATPPRTQARVVPSREDPPMAAPPTVAEMDALVREARRRGKGSLAGPLLEIMRGTGLRVSQVCALQVRDIDWQAEGGVTLTVRKGKSAAERPRTVPVAPTLLPLLRRLCEGRRPRAQVVDKRPGNSTLRSIKDACVARGEARTEVFRPEGRRNERISHYMRAGLQRHLRRRRVEDRVIDLLVGHTGSSVRDRHYDRGDWEELVAAVAQVPPVAPEPERRSVPDRLAAK